MVTLLAYSLFIMFIGSMIHFTYESLILPNIRFSIRFELYSLRDELRLLKIKYGSEFDDKVFLIADDSINNTLKFLPRASISYFFRVKKIVESNKKLQKEINRRIDLVDKFHISEIKDISNKSNKLLRKVFYWNSLMLFIYISPFLIVFAITLFVYFLLESFYKGIKQLITKGINVKWSFNLVLLKGVSIDLYYRKARMLIRYIARELTFSKDSSKWDDHGVNFV